MVTDKITKKSIAEKEKELIEREEELALKEASMESIKKLDVLIRHISNVQEACVILGKRLMETGEIDFGINLIANSMLHDFSKFKGIEWEALNSDMVDSDKSRFLDALNQHRNTNQHHPEYWGGINDMPRIYVAEMVCDWYSRSVEMGTDLRSFFTDVACERFSISKNGKKYKEIKLFINMLLDNTFKAITKKE